RAVTFRVECALRIVRRVFDRSSFGFIECYKLPLPKQGKCLVASDGQQPRCDLAPPLEAPGLAPDVEEHLAERVLGQTFIPRKPMDKAVDLVTLPNKEDLHREFVATRNRLDELLVGSLRGHGRLTIGGGILQLGRNFHDPSPSFQMILTGQAWLRTPCTTPERT